MRNEAKRPVRRVKAGRIALGVLTILLVLVLAVAGCGEAATATPEPAPPTAVPQPTPTTPPSEPATSVPDPATTATTEPSEPDAPTAVPPTPVPPTPEPTLRAMSEWTPENPATLEEIEAELEKRRGSTLLFKHPGGGYGAALRQAVFDPLEQKFGLQVVEDSPSPSTAEIRALAETGQFEWHLVEMGTARAVALLKSDSMGEYDPAIVDARDLLSAVTEPGPYLAGGGTTWSLVLAYNTDVYPGDTGPKNWDDFFDLESFPGRRALYRYLSYSGHIQIQRMARNPDLLNTPEGKQEIATPSREQMEEDFAWFDEWTDEAGNDVIYWETGAQCPELLLSGEVEMCTTWNGRIFDAQQQGAPLAICWECGYIIGTSGWNIAKHLKELDPEAYELANLVMAWDTFPENNARISLYISYGPANIKAIEYLDDPAYDAVRDELPSAPGNIPYAVVFDELWLAEQTEWASEQYIVATQ